MTRVDRTKVSAKSSGSWLCRGMRNTGKLRWNEEPAQMKWTINSNRMMEKIIYLSLWISKFVSLLSLLYLDIEEFSPRSHFYMSPEHFHSSSNSCGRYIVTRRKVTLWISFLIATLNIEHNINTTLLLSSSSSRTFLTTQFSKQYWSPWPSLSFTLLCQKVRNYMTYIKYYWFRH
jgi:hypothetical protein